MRMWCTTFLLSLVASLSFAASGAVSYTYDDMGRLVAEKHGAVVYTYTYDTNGNLLRRVAKSSVSSADLAVSATHSVGGQAGSSMTFTVAVSNAGPDAATGVVITNTLPPDVTVVSARAGQGACDIGAGGVTCDLGTVASGVVVTVMIEVVPGESGSLTNLASVVCALDSNASNNSAADVATIAPVADLTLTRLASPDPVSSNAYVTYTLIVDNRGPSDASGVVVTDTVPASVTIHSVAPSQGSCETNGQVLTCSLGGIAADASATVTIVGRPTSVVELTNTASVVAAEPDPDTANNTATVTTGVQRVDFVVTTTADNSTNPPPGSLRQAILDANAAGGAPVITFDLPGNTVPLIQLVPDWGNQLPDMLVGMTIDGFSHPSGRVEIRGGTTGDLDRDGVLHLKRDGITLRGLVVNPSAGTAVYVEGNDNAIEGCLIGTDSSGTGVVTWASVGIKIVGDRNRIGGVEPWQRNVVSGCRVTGIEIESFGSYNVIENCLVGTDITGTRALGNGDYDGYWHSGVLLQSGAGNLIGGDAPGAANVISGNGNCGLRIDADGVYEHQTPNRVIGNLIGTDITGLQPLGNGADGIRLYSASDIILRNNTIADSGEYGVDVAGSSAHYEETLVIAGNRIGTDVTGTRDLGNALGGLWVHAPTSRDIKIGGLGTGDGNIISGNDGTGILIENGASNIKVYANLIGLDTTGRTALTNGGHGIVVSNGAHHVSIGAGSVSGQNTISGSGGHGILIDGAYACAVAGNLVGLARDGSSMVGNGLSGVVMNNAWGNTIGGNFPPDANLICGSGQHGIRIGGANALSNVVLNAHIGTDSVGQAALGNAADGIRIDGATATRIGGDGAYDAVTVAFNGGNGIGIASGTGNRIVASEIFSNGGLGIDLGGDGVTANDAGDGDTGANGSQNFPVITSVLGGSAHVRGTLDSAAGRPYRLDFFLNAEADESGHGEGAVYLGTTNVTTDGGGSAGFSAHFPGSLPAGTFVTATATDMTTGNTSEFSAAVEFAAGDADGDGLPDVWEQHYFGGPTNAVPGADPDGDGFTTFQEYITVTDPTDPASHFRIMSIDGRSGITVSFPSSSSRLYQLQYTDDLTDTNGWTDHPPAHPGSDTATGLIDSTTRSNRSYRVNVRLR